MSSSQPSRTFSCAATHATASPPRPRRPRPPRLKGDSTVGTIATDIGTLLVIEHVVMLPAMLVAMLLRRDEYSGHTHHHGPAEQQRLAA